jgi:UDP-N-acetylglucosamine--dolichyl-phosphate N-acetylglucosaminephosphotransferase
MIFMVENLFYFILLSFSFLLSLFFSIKLVSFFIKVISKTSFLGKDMNKINRPFVCELGGVPVFLSFILSILLVFLLNYVFIIIFNLDFSLLNLIQFSLVLLTLFLIFFLGFIDDILGWKKGISQIQHFLMPIIFSIPMIVYALIFDVSSIYIPLIGILNVSFIYAFIFVPVAITATSNSLNLLAGYNGFEAGMGIIIFLTISIFSLFLGNFTLLIILFAWIGALLGFLKFNKFPSKIFPGDIITLVNGAFIGICAIILGLELLIAFLIVLFILEFIIKARHSFKTECFGITLKNGIIKPNPKGGSLIHFVLRRGKFTEKKLVFTFYIIQGIISLISLILFYIVYI